MTRYPGLAQWQRLAWRRLRRLAGHTGGSVIHRSSFTAAVGADGTVVAYVHIGNGPNSESGGSKWRAAVSGWRWRHPPLWELQAGWGLIPAASAGFKQWALAGRSALAHTGIPAARSSSGGGVHQECSTAMCTVLKRSVDLRSAAWLKQRVAGRRRLPFHPFPGWQPAVFPQPGLVDWHWHWH